MLDLLRDGIDAHAPSIGRVIRSVKDRRRLANPVVTRFGFRLASGPTMATDAWEVQELEAFLKHLEHAAVCVDIGANVGFYTCLAASRGKRVVAVEPLARNLRFLYRNLLYNGFLDVEVYPVAVSDRPGLKRLYGDADMASLVAGWGNARETNYNLVPVSTVDAFVPSRAEGARMVIKMDVEGFELEALRGAERTLSLTPQPVWLVEILLNNFAIPGGVSDSFYETFEVFWTHGYESRLVGLGERVVSPDEVSRWVARGSIDAPSQNFLFIHPIG